MNEYGHWNFIYKIVFRLFAKSECRIQIIKNIWMETLFLWKSVVAYRYQTYKGKSCWHPKPLPRHPFKDYKKNTGRGDATEMDGVFIWKMDILIFCKLPPRLLSHCPFSGVRAENASAHTKVWICRKLGRNSWN